MKPFKLSIGAVVAVLLVITAACGSNQGGLGNTPVIEHDDSDGDGQIPDVPQRSSVPVFAYVAGGPYAEVLPECTYANGFFSACDLETLPYLGQDDMNPGLDDVLDRLVVSDQWMGDNFSALLAEMPDDVLPMFRSVKAVVIARDIVPRRFVTGVLYLDPSILWLEASEESVLPGSDDGSALAEREARPLGTAAGLGFRIPHRYVREGAVLRVPVDGDGARSVQDLLPLFGGQIYHMLAHAADQMAPDRLPTLTQEDYYSLVWGSFYFGPHESDDWSLANPVNSSVAFGDLLLQGLARVRFLGEEPTQEQLATGPETVARQLAEEGAVRFYSYTDPKEDFALAFETAMMAFHFGYADEIAVTDNVAPSVDDAIVAWGQRGRIGEQQVFSRVLAAVQAIYQGDLSAVEIFLASRPPAVLLDVGRTWAPNPEQAPERA